jgi:hypothetical protein
MYIIGDVHGHWAELVQAIESKINHFSDKSLSFLQLGDLGLGFPNHKIFPHINNFKFIRGNHDNPESCKVHPYYLGDYGTYTFDNGTKLFYISGAFSIDKDYRTPGLNWWRDEELSQQDMSKAIELYCYFKPNLVVSHDCPLSARDHFLLTTHHDEKSITNIGLQIMFDAWQPNNWIFGHHHKKHNFIKNNTNFNCVAELSFYELKDLEWTK